MYQERGTQVVLRGTQALQRWSEPGWRKHENATEAMMQDVVAVTSPYLASQSRVE